MNCLTNFEYLTRKFGAISGQVSGIIRNYAVYSKGISGYGGLNIVTGSMPPYTKLTISPEHDMSYHISGYGNTIEEAYIRFIGESVERYASIMSHVYLNDRIISGSYKEMSRQYETVMPPDYLNNLTREQLEQMRQMNPAYEPDPVTEDTEIAWVRAHSLADPERETLVPASMFFVGFLEDHIRTPAFTTGCAVHENIYKAMINGLIEYIQIDAFMAHWYTDTPKYRVKFDSLPRHVQDAINRSLGDNKNKYDVCIINYSDLAKVRVPVIGVFIIAKEPTTFPAIAFGVQSGTSLENTFYRGVQEALAVLEMSLSVPFSNPDTIRRARDKNNPFFDLDTNVAYYSLPENYEANREFIFRHVAGEITYQEIRDGIKDLSGMDDREKLAWLMKQVSSFSDYACFLDITPPNVGDPTLRAARTFVPELLHMSFPGYPYLKHHRYQEVDAEIESYPHPLP